MFYTYYNYNCNIHSRCRFRREVRKNKYGASAIAPSTPKSFDLVSTEYITNKNNIEDDRNKMI